MPEAPHPFVVWNVERLFRATGSSIARSLGATAAEGWTPDNYKAKVSAVGAVLRAATNGARPAFIGLIEVENQRVVSDVCRAAGWPELRDVEPADERVTGYDVAIAYDPAVFSGVAHAESWTINNRFATRDILLARLKAKAGGELAVCLVHWPSRTIPYTDPLRIAAGAFCAGIIERALKYQRDELFDTRGRQRLPPLAELAARWNTRLLVMGDFNDEPWDASLRALAALSRQASDAIRPPRLPKRDSGRNSLISYLELRPRLYNTAWELFGGTGPYGTIRFDGTWQLLEQILVSAGALQQQGPRYQVGSLRVFAPETVTDRNGETITMRSGSGQPLGFDRDTGRGVSDHLPLVATIVA